jgi:hypothetical protein
MMLGSILCSWPSRYPGGVRWRNTPGVFARHEVQAVLAQARVSLTFQHLQNVLRKAVSNLSVSGHWLRSLCGGVLIPIMPPPVTYQNAPHFFDLSDKVSPFHATRSSPTL